MRSDESEKLTVKYIETIICCVYFEAKPYWRAETAGKPDLVG